MTAASIRLTRDFRTTYTRLTPRSLPLLLLIALTFSSAYAQDPLKLLPDNYKLIFDNAEISVIRAHYGAHEQIPVHDHTSDAALFVYLSDSGPVRIDHAEAGEKPVSVMRPPTVKGSYRIAPGLAERHSIENLGDTSSDFLRVELKHVVLQLKEPFRGKAPQSLTANLNANEFTAPGLEVERLVCVAPASCPLLPSPAPSLLIAFTSLNLSPNEGWNAPLSLPAGSVHWLPASQPLLLTPSATIPAHLLRILLPPARQPVAAGASNLHAR